MNKNSLSLHLFKQNLKFSSAHFLIFNQHDAEMLHGHNYQVQLDIYACAEGAMNNLGYLVDFGVLKKRLRSIVNQWDEHVLLPKSNPEIKISDFNEFTYKVEFRDRVYAFPKNEVVLLPIFNTSVELLSLHLSERLLSYLSQYKIECYHTRVEETLGQGATYIRYLSR